jgi:predicted small lipoprotein YifL
MRVLILAAAAATLAACGQSAPETYPPQFVLNFMRACQAQGPSQQFCACTWEKVETAVAPADFAAFERLPVTEQATHPVQQQIERFALECAAQLQPPVEDPPPP